MANPVKAIQIGFDYQAIHFWLQACRLFDDRTKVVKVGYELDEVKSFDDVVVDYLEPIRDGVGGSKSKDYFQVKYHVNQNGFITFESLIDPAFIGATTFSLLQKLQKALQGGRDAGVDCNYFLITPWAIHPENLLSQLITNDSGGINFSKLNEGKTEKSMMGGVRKVWTDHLSIKDTELLDILRPLRIHTNPMTIDQLEDMLSTHLLHAGFVPIDKTKAVRPYQDLIRRLHAEGRNYFTRQDLQEIATQEGLYAGKKEADEIERIPRIGIRSFWRFAEHLEDEVDDLLSLNEYFNHRHILSPDLWRDPILPKVKEFVKQHMSSDIPVHIYLDTHGSIAFAAGYFSDGKGRSQIVPVQCGMSRQRELWPVSNEKSAERDRVWQIESKLIREDGGVDLAVAVSITHSVVSDVIDFVNRELPSVERLISFDVLPKPGRTSITGGTHAYQLAEDLAQYLYGLKKTEEIGVFHIFIAGPNGFQFYLGALSHLFGDCKLYEYDFEAKKLGAYTEALSFLS